MSLTADQILALAPDAGSAAAGHSLASLSKWGNLGSSPQALWGECQGSGSKPYQTQIDLGEPAFKCSCPSRKFPCKHGLALYLLFAGHADSFAAGEPPDWVSAWLESRSERAAKAAGKVEKAATQGKDPDHEGQAKRALQREQKVRSGLDELELWLTDLIRGGLFQAQQQPYGYWETMAKRLVDAQAPGLSRRVSALRPIPGSPDWQDRLLADLGSLHLLVRAARRMDELPAALREDVRSLIGWTIREEDLLSQNGVPDEWWVIGQTVENETNLLTMRTWLYGRTSRRFALLLQFAHVSQPLVRTAVPGTKFEAELVYFPGACPLRAAIKSRQEFEPLEWPALEDVPRQGVSAVHEILAEALALNPWMESVPVALPGVTVRPAATGHWWAHSDEGSIPLPENFAAVWHLLAATGGEEFTLWGTWNGRTLTPLAATSPGGYIQLEGRWPA